MGLNIDVQKVLNSKKKVLTPLEESFNTAVLNQSPINIVNFMTKYKSSSKETILENLGSLCKINSDITFNYFKDILPHAEFSESKMNEIKDQVKSILDSTDDDSHKIKLESSISVIDSIIESNNDIQKIHDDMIVNLNIDRIRKHCIYESYIENDLDVLVYNINTSPETISDYELLIRKIKTSKGTEYFSSFPNLLVKNTELILNLRIKVSGDVLDLLTSMPTVIANKLVSEKVSNTVLKSYCKIFDKQIAILYTELKNNEPKQYQLYSTYLKRLTEAKLQLMNCNKAVKESVGGLDEGISEMGPDIILYDEGVIEDVVAEIEDTLADIIFDPDDEINEKALENFIRLCRVYESATRKAAIKTGHSIGDKVQKGVSNLKAKATDAKRSTLPIKKAFDPVFNLISGTVNKMKEMDKKERTERIITGNYRFKLTSLIKKGIIALAVGSAAKAGGSVIGKVAVGAIKVTAGHLGTVILAAIGLLVAVALDKKADKKRRQEILVDLKNELKIVEEKIEDAKGDGNKAEKYQLMRIQQQLKKDIERITYNLD